MQTCHSRTLQDSSEQLIIDSVDTTRTHSNGQVENVTWVPCSNLHKHDPPIWEWDSTHATTGQGSQNLPSHVSGSNNLSSPFMPKTLTRNPKSAINLVRLGLKTLNTVINPCRVAIPYLVNEQCTHSKRLKWCYTKEEAQSTSITTFTACMTPYSDT